MLSKAEVTALVDRPLSFWDMLGVGKKRFQPAQSRVVQPQSRANLAQRHLAAGIGLIAFLLPLGLLLGQWLAGCEFRSISHYYYSRYLGGYFVGCLFFVAAGMMGYGGQSQAEARLTFILGLLAAVVAYVPTVNSGCIGQSEIISQGRVFASHVQSLPEFMASASSLGLRLFPGADQLHLICAGLLLLGLAFYVGFGFTRIDWLAALANVDAGKYAISPKKIMRNRIYITLAVFMVLVLVIGGYYELTGTQAGWKSTPGLFWVEALALFAFGIAWFIKGRGFGLLDWMGDQDA